MSLNVLWLLSKLIFVAHSPLTAKVARKTLFGRYVNLGPVAIGPIWYVLKVIQIVAPKIKSPDLRGPASNRYPDSNSVNTIKSSKDDIS